MDCCADCGTLHLHSDYKRLAQIKFLRTLCQTCYKIANNKRAMMTERTCQRCGVVAEVVDAANPRCQNCRVADSVGADYFQCDCGDTVPIAESVRLMRKGSGRIERVCMKCSQDGACARDKHAIVTTKHKDWDEARWTFLPVPDSLQRGACSRCTVQFFWDGGEWRRMSWTVLAEHWEKADA